MSFEIRPATRQGVKPLIGLYSESGCGKTYSSLLLARGFVGPSGKIVMVDTESGRGSLYADVLPGGYDVLELRQPFSPGRYIEAIEAVEKSGAQLGIIDSASHEWEGSGGVLDMATEREAKSGKPGLHNWREPKMEHQKFMLRLLQSPVPWIVNLRAKHKTKQGKNAQGRTEIVKDEFTTPIQADDFIFEMTVHGEILKNHHFNLTKCSHPDLRRCMPNNEPTTVEHGKLLAQWCASAGGNGNSQAAKVPLDERKALAQKIWNELKEVRGPEKNWMAAEVWLVAKKIIADTETVTELPVERLKEILDKVEIELNDVPTP